IAATPGAPIRVFYWATYCHISRLRWFRPVSAQRKPRSKIARVAAFSRGGPVPLGTRTYSCLPYLLCPRAGGNLVQKRKPLLNDFLIQQSRAGFLEEKHSPIARPAVGLQCCALPKPSGRKNRTPTEICETGKIQHIKKTLRTLFGCARPYRDLSPYI
ncbi:MAG: hypothetical protein K2K83_02765, partial [Rikenella sp.]|nr:hypothetical protein [Rikenella sp.]